MLRDFHPAGIKHLLKETIAAICLFAHCAMRVDCLSNIYYLVRVQCHDFSRVLPSQIIVDQGRRGTTQGEGETAPTHTPPCQRGVLYARCGKRKTGRGAESLSPLKTEPPPHKEATEHTALQSVFCRGKRQNYLPTFERPFQGPLTSSYMGTSSIASPRRVSQNCDCHRRRTNCFRV